MAFVLRWSVRKHARHWVPSTDPFRIHFSGFSTMNLCICICVLVVSCEQGAYLRKIEHLELSTILPIVYCAARYDLYVYNKNFVLQKSQDQWTGEWKKGPFLLSQDSLIEHKACSQKGLKPSRR